MIKKKTVDFIFITIVTAIILIASIMVYTFTPGNQAETSYFQMKNIINTIRDFHFSQYPDFNELYFSSGKGYEFRNESSNGLIIYLGEYGWGSAIQARWSGKLIDALLAITELTEKYTFFVPEKFYREIGVLYGLIPEERQRYTIDNLIDNYYEVISEYLSQNNFESIIIYGASEGAFILPVLYSRLNNWNITALISDSGGGWLTYSEQQQVLLVKLLRNEKSFASHPASKEEHILLRNYYETWVQTFQARQPSEPQDSIDFFLNSPMTYKWFSSIIKLRLSDYYEKIDIPVLFIHGNMDIDVPVETTKYLENNLKHKQFDYRYYADMTHNQIEKQEYLPQKDIIEWILKIDP